ncbi:hypothetical protein G9A89_005207 [Geosiphon pyriformis]|nr:hypothetical protein G9A89_005207 [Geosiphon pyriformis]
MVLSYISARDYQSIVIVIVMNILNISNKVNENESSTKRRLPTSDKYFIPLPITLSLFSLFGFRNLFRWIHFSFLYQLNSTSPSAIGAFDSDLLCVKVTRRDHIDFLWSSGFFGKGVFSRSEATWFARKTKRKSRAGNFGDSFLEEATEKRRQQRKMDRKTREKLDLDLVALPILDHKDDPLEGIHLDREEEITDGPNFSEISIKPPTIENSNVCDDDIDKYTQDIEHLQLTLEEAFFLSYGLGCLKIKDCNEKLLSIKECWNSFCNAAANHYSQQPTIQLSTASRGAIENRRENPFVIRYVAYHYFRSLGWVVRCGSKFGVDYILYEKGPMFNHGEYAVVVLPVYSGSSEDPLKIKGKMPSNFPLNCLSSRPPYSGFRQNITSSWGWLLSLNRVCSQAKKTVVLCYVIIPGLKEYSAEEMGTPDFIKRFHIHEVTLKRFIPERNNQCDSKIISKFHNINKNI